jgi:hypothetical protein
MSHEKLHFKAQQKLTYVKVRNKTKNPVKKFYTIHFVELMRISNLAVNFCLKTLSNLNLKSRRIYKKIIDERENYKESFPKFEGNCTLFI